MKRDPITYLAFLYYYRFVESVKSIYLFYYSDQEEKVLGSNCSYTEQSWELSVRKFHITYQSVAS
jgi:hypothetical protein